MEKLYHIPENKAVEAAGGWKQGKIFFRAGQAGDIRYEIRDIR
ncbi:MAG: hypothetical protein ACI4P4_02580 [Faecousia sp.]